MTDHTARLLERLGERGVVLAADPQLDALVEGLFDRAEGRLPHRPIGRDAVVDRVADALLASDDTPDGEALARLNAADLYLALALLAKDLRALQILEAELLPAVRQAAGRVEANEAFIDEVSDRVHARLLIGDDQAPPAISQYRGIGPLARWVRSVTSRVALELKRAHDEHGIAFVPGDPATDAIWCTCADAYEAALAEAFAGLSRRERNLLRQRYLDDLDPEVLGRVYRVNPETTTHWLRQLEERLAAATRVALMAKVAISEVHVHRVARLVTRQLPLSLRRMLRSAGGVRGGYRGDGRRAR